MPLAVRTRNEPAFKGEVMWPFGAPPPPGLRNRAQLALNKPPGRQAAHTQTHASDLGAAPGGPLTLPSGKPPSAPPTGAAV